MPPTNCLKIILNTTSPKIITKIENGIRNTYGKYITEIDDDDTLIEYSESDEHKEIEKTMTPGIYVKHCREVHGLTQKQLGEKLGHTSASRISDWETGQRDISKSIALKLAKMFNLTVEKLITN